MNAVGEERLFLYDIDYVFFAVLIMAISILYCTGLNNNKHLVVKVTRSIFAIMY